jgi:Protein of unknown function (DUF4012)
MAERAPVEKGPRDVAEVASGRIAWRHLALLGAGVIALVLGMAAFQILSARSHLLDGAKELAAAEAALRSPLALQSAGFRANLHERLATSTDDFSQARDDLSAWSPFLDHMGAIPAIGSQLEAASPAADAALFTARSADRLELALAPAAVLLSHPGREDRLVALTRLLNASQGELTAARDDAQLATAAVQQLPTDLGSGSLNGMASRLKRRLPLLQRTTAWLALAPRLLGAVHPAQYLFGWENPAEIRAVGGFIGANDLMTVQDGRVTHDFHGNAFPHEITTALLPLPEALYTPEDYLLFVDSNWSPDFPLSARLERWFYGEDTGIWTNTIINFLDPGIVGILKATGPIYVKPFHRWVDSRNVQALAQAYVHGHYHGPEQVGLVDTIRKQFFGAVLQALVMRMKTMTLARFGALGQALGAAIAHRDILIYDRRPEVEAAIRAIGADGSLVAPAGDFLYIVDDNRSYNKLNPYVDETATYSATVESNLWIDATLSIRYHVNPSPWDLEGFGPDWGRWGTKHDYQDFLRIYVPAGTELRSMTGVQMWVPQPAYGTTQISGRLLVRKNQTVIVTVKYRIPANALVASGADHYRLTVRRQPGANLKSLRIDVTGGPGVRIGPTGRVSRAVRFDADVRLSVPVAGSVHPEPIRLPAPVFKDPYLPYGSLNDPRHPL